MMGQGIAYVSAKAGIDVVLKDMTQESADKGKLYSVPLLKNKSLEDECFNLMPTKFSTE